jgi:hypothetical protein
VTIGSLIAGWAKETGKDGKALCRATIKVRKPDNQDEKVVAPRAS